MGKQLALLDFPYEHKPKGLTELHIKASFFSYINQDLKRLWYMYMYYMVSI